MRTEFITNNDGLRDVRYVENDIVAGRSVLGALLVVGIVLIGAGVIWLSRVCRGL